MTDYMYIFRPGIKQYKVHVECNMWCSSGSGRRVGVLCEAKSSTELHLPSIKHLSIHALKKKRGKRLFFSLSPFLFTAALNCQLWGNIIIISTTEV